MLTIELPDIELFDEATNEFTTLPAATLQLEHSLVSLSRWESKWKKPFLNKDEKTNEQTIDYVRMMCLNEVPSDIFDKLPKWASDKIGEYIADSMTATWFSDQKPGTPARPSREIITAEIIYYWMISYNIPITCEEWHLNRLLTLIKVCAEKNKPQGKMSKAEVLARHKQINEQRRASAAGR